MTRRDDIALVVVESALYGDTATVADQVTEDGAVLDMPYLPPLGCPLHVRFLGAGEGPDDLALIATVIGHTDRGERRLVLVQFGGPVPSLASGEGLAAELAH